MVRGEEEIALQIMTALQQRVLFGPADIPRKKCAITF